MKRHRLNIKNISVTIILLLGIYMVLSSGYHNYESDGLIKNTKPEDVWNYVADFSKMRLLNPSMYVYNTISVYGKQSEII